MLFLFQVTTEMGDRNNIYPVQFGNSQCRYQSQNTV